MSEIWAGQWAGPGGPVTLDAHVVAIRAGQSPAPSSGALAIAGGTISSHGAEPVVAAKGS